MRAATYMALYEIPRSGEAMASFPCAFSFPCVGRRSDVDLHLNKYAILPRTIPLETANLPTSCGELSENQTCAFMCPGLWVFDWID